MKHIYYFSVFAFLSFIFNIKIANGQACSSTLSNGINLVTNYDFSQGYTGWTHDPGYTNYTPCGLSCWSSPGNVYAGDNQWDFNGAFTTFPDHSASADNNMLMVDGICQLGVNLWSQSGIPLTPNTNYYFSIWATCLKAQAPYGTLRFDINGTPLGVTITADGNSGSGPTVGNWVKYTATWNSGLTPPATATISIQNTTITGCNTAVDFAVDDITFTPGCDFGTPGPVPNLGADFTICGKTVPFNINPGFNAATAARADITYTWFKDGVQQTSGMGNAFYNFPVSTFGTYAVCVDSAGSCKKTDMITITNSYSINLGPDLVLCNPTTATLDAGYTGPGVTYQWSFNGTPISGATNKTLSLTLPGTYSVSVTDPVCGLQSSQLNISTNAAIPVDATFCPVASGGTGKANLSVIGSGKYKWWNHPTSTNPVNVVGTGNNFTTPILVATKIYYVEDTSTFALTVGPPAVGNGFSNVASMSAGTGDPGNLLVFNALTTFKLDSITLLPYNYYCPTPNVTGTGNNNVANIIIYDNTGAIVGTSSYTATCNGQGTPAPPMKVPVGITIPQGTGYQIRLNSGSTQFAKYLNTTGSGGNPPTPELYHYPTSYSSAVEFVANSSSTYSLYYSPDAIAGYFDWKITKGINCERVPVTASKNCPLCTDAVVPTSISVDNPTFCAGVVSNITLSTVGGSGENLVWYSGSCGGTQVGTNTTGADVIITAPSITTTYFARWESPSLSCNSPCLSLTVTPKTPPTASVAGSPQTLCNVTTTALTANTPASGTGLWSVVSGTGTIANYTSPTSGVSGLVSGDLVLDWTISNAPCAASSSQVTIHRDALVAPVFSLTGQSWDTCANTTGVSYATTIDRSATNTYIWSTTGTLNITGQSANSVTLNVGASGGTLQLTEVSASCSLSISKAVTISPSISAPNAGVDKPVCITTIKLGAISPAVGAGQWTVSAGSGIFADDLLYNTTVSGLSNGVNTFTWTVTGCGGPLSDDITITVGTSTLVANLKGPSDTTCVGTDRYLTSSISGGSGDYTYKWTSSDPAFVSPGVTFSAITVNSQQTIATYYLTVMDHQNSGCTSNKDSITLIAIPSQVLIIPNLITPNGDNRNDALEIRGEGLVTTLLPNTSLEISNRWGERVYNNSSYDNTWKGADLSDGVYYYYLMSGCGAKVYKGWIQLVK